MAFDGRSDDFFLEWAKPVLLEYSSQREFNVFRLLRPLGPSHDLQLAVVELAGVMFWLRGSRFGWK